MISHMLRVRARTALVFIILCASRSLLDVVGYVCGEGEDSEEGNDGRNGGNVVSIAEMTLACYNLAG